MGRKKGQNGSRENSKGEFQQNDTEYSIFIATIEINFLFRVERTN